MSTYEEAQSFYSVQQSLLANSSQPRHSRTPCTMHTGYWRSVITCKTNPATTTISWPLHRSTRMWANAQRDGRPAEYRWRPLFNAAKFGWRPLLECHAVTKPKRETRWNLQGCPKLTKRSQPLVGRSSPYYGAMWRRYCCLTSFFSDCRYMPYLRRYSPTKLWDGAQMAIFGDFFASCIFSEPHAARFRPAS